MCSIIGWFGAVPNTVKKSMMQKASERGRDGVGFWADGTEFRYTDNQSIKEPELFKILGADRVVGNYRAEPTTEARSTLKNLQPYRGIVHNGIIANDKEFGDHEIDSMVLPLIFEDRELPPDELAPHLAKIKGSYALAYFSQRHLVLACNYKPIYYRFIQFPNGWGFVFGSTPDIVGDGALKISPYSASRVDTANGHWEGAELLENKSNRVVVSASSGLDSTAVAYLLKSKGYEVSLAHFLYGCKAEKREIQRILEIAKHGGFELDFFEMPKQVLKGSIVEGRYHEGGIEGTEYAHDWVSARNLLMLSILTAHAESNQIGYIAFGGNLEEAGAYPDNEQEFGRMFQNILPYAVQNGVRVDLLQPVATMMKHEIVKVGEWVKTPWELTWSCYGDGDKHCGKCGPCFMRKTAFERNGLKDPVFDS